MCVSVSVCVCVIRVMHDLPVCMGIRCCVEIVKMHFHLHCMYSSTHVCPLCIGGVPCVVCVLNVFIDPSEFADCLVVTETSKECTN